MKSKKLLLLEKLLRWMAIAVLKIKKPKIIAVTGSVGKTSTAEAIYVVLLEKFNVRRNQKNYNNEIGIPLTIIGAESGGNSIFGWLYVFLKWIFVVVFPMKYPQILVLEFAVDRPGNMKYLTGFVHPLVGVVTNVSSSHMEFFQSLEKIAKEKGFLVEALLPGEMAVLNADDKNVLEMRNKIKSDLITFGYSQEAMVRADRVVYNYDDNQRPDGISFKLEYEGKSIPVRLKNILAPHQIYAVLAAVAVGIFFKINLVEASGALEDMHSPQGRMNLISGIKNTYLIDDTYNASPTSTLAALEVLESLGARRRIVVLGDMLELGSEEKSGHQKIGEKIFQAKIDLFVAVGKRMRDAVEKAVSLGFAKERIFVFDDPEIASRKVQDVLQEGDLVLIKGSQGMRMEKIIKEIMADSNEAENILCRQDKNWREKPFIQP